MTDLLHDRGIARLKALTSKQHSGVQQEHPDTVGGAMLTGVREAVRALRMLKGASEEEANAAAGGVDGGLPSRKRKQVSGLVLIYMLTWHYAPDVVAACVLVAELPCGRQGVCLCINSTEVAGHMQKALECRSGCKL